MVSEFWQNFLIFIVVFIFFLPLLNKTVRLATRAIEDREFIDDEQYKRVVYIVPITIILALIAFYYIVKFLVDVIQI